MRERIIERSRQLGLEPYVDTPRKVPVHDSSTESDDSTPDPSDPSEPDRLNNVNWQVHNLYISPTSLRCPS